MKKTYGLKHKSYVLFQKYSSYIFDLCNDFNSWLLAIGNWLPSFVLNYIGNYPKIGDHQFYELTKKPLMSLNKNLFTYCLLIFQLISLSHLNSQNTYHVSKSGNDSNPGTSSQPFLTIQRAADIAGPGDIVSVSTGTYRETVTPTNSGTSGSPITYIASGNVVISGMEPLDGWTASGNGIYEKVVSFSLGNDNMIMYGSQLCDLARFPNNVDGNPFTIDADQNTGGSLTNMIGNFPDLEWQLGGFLWYLGNSRWTSWRSEVLWADPYNIGVNAPSGWEGSNHNPANGGEYILMGIPEALDHEYEYYYDSSNSTLSLQTPGGVSPPNGTVEMKQRMLGIDLTNKSHIIVNGINVYGCSIEITGSATGNEIRNLSVLWGNHTWAVGGAALIDGQSIKLDGNNNLVKGCEIAWGANNGIIIKGNGNIVDSCNIHDFDYLASYGAPVMLRGGTNSALTQSTIYNGGRDAIQCVNTNSEIAYNDVYQSNLINDDCGPFYTCCGDFNTEVHHNFFHSSYSRGSHYKAAGIYLDNSAKNMDVHHNVVFEMEWTGIQMNWDSWDLNIFNNVIWNVSATMGSWQPSGTSMSNVYVFNNLSNDDTWLGTQFDQNLMLSSSPFVDYPAQNFELQNGSVAIDYGIEVSGLTEPFNGTAPDAGSFESGSIPWVPGHLGDEGALPIELLSFEVSATSHQKVDINWATASEINNDYFTIEKSKNGMDWETVTRVRGQGDAIVTQRYHSVDESPFSGTSYYRLIQTDFDGQFEFSDIRSVIIKEKKSVNIFPNPTSEKVVVSFGEDFDPSSDLNFIIRDITGKQLTDYNIGNVTDYSFELDLSPLPNGVYFLSTNYSNHKIIKTSRIN